MTATGIELTQPGFQTPLTIRAVIENIDGRNYLLPAIQREFVWGPEQVIKLFDSLMKDYTIGTFLFWDVKKDKVKKLGPVFTRAQYPFSDDS